jgi:hypothetical protein
LLSLLLVATIVTSTCACGTTTTVDLGSDPESSAVRMAFYAGEPVEITGYTRVSDGHRDWQGLVQLAPPDSVQFTPPQKTSPTTTRSRSRRLEFRIARKDLASVDIRGYDTLPSEFAADPGRNAISVASTSPGHGSNRGSQRALTIGLFVAIVGAAVIGYSIAGQ